VSSSILLQVIIIVLILIGKRVRIRRRNTTEEKWKMKRERRVRKRQMRRCSTVEISKQLLQAKADHEKVKKQLTFNQKLAQLYWDHWRHEVQERKHKRSIPSSHVHLPQIPRSALLVT